MSFQISPDSPEVQRARTERDAYVRVVRRDGADSDTAAVARTRWRAAAQASAAVALAALSPEDRERLRVTGERLRAMRERAELRNKAVTA